ncbi:hypothetical protein [uncultured Methanoregula sp.]|uniref:hypothetical protein n=1 Tax=uncultured Methanoregula sp. TaxID=1005933 RepID=UPI002AAADB4C|nr:hypothetical protein [uncultured Methanoregula sp.]
MGSPYLSNNETILLSTHNIVINTIPSEAILTSNRLMLLDFSHPQILPQDIPFGAIETVTIGDNSAKEPVLSLSIIAPDEARHTLGIVFSQPQKTKRGGERDTWAAKIKEMSLAAQQEHGVKSAELLPPWVPGELPTDTKKDREKTGQSENVYRPLNPVQKRSRSAAGPKKGRAMAAGAVIVILIAAVVLGSWFLAPSLWGKVTGVSAPAPVPVSTTVATTVPTPEPVETTVPVTIATPVETVTETITVVPTLAPQSQIPRTGVWIHVTYDGKFTGTIGTSGNLKDIAGSAQGLYQIPVTQGMLLATVEKLDNSVNVLTIDFYKDGVLLQSSTTKAPKGTVDAQVTIPATPTTIIVKANTTA